MIYESACCPKRKLDIGHNCINSVLLLAHTHIYFQSVVYSVSVNRKVLVLLLSCKKVILLSFNSDDCWSVINMQIIMWCSQL